MTVKNEIGIINFALLQLSIDPISSTNEQSKISRTMSSIFPIAKETVLRSYVYDWSHKVEKLTEYGDDDGGYVKPADYINFIGLGDVIHFCCCTSDIANVLSYEHSASVREVNGRLYIQSCCLHKYTYLHYTYNNMHYDSMPLDLFETIGYKAAYLAAMPLTNNRQLTEIMRQRMEDAGGKARSHAGFENKTLNDLRPRLYPLMSEKIGLL